MLSVLIGVVGAMVLTSFAGARRAESAFERFRARSNSADAVVESVGGSRQPMDSAGWTVVSRLPGVDRVAPFAFVPFIPSSAGPEELVGGFVSTDGTWLYEVDVPRVVEGRLPSPDRPDEVAINEQYAEWLDLTPGDRLSGTTASPEQSGGEDVGGGGQGPSVQLRVTGVVRLPSDIAFNAGTPVAYFTPAFYEKYASTVGFASALAWVRLEQDQSFSTFNAALRGLPRYGEHLRASDLSGVSVDVDDATAVQARALVLLGLALALAGMLILAQLMARHMDGANDVQAALRALGFDQRQRCVAAAMPLIAAAFLGVAGSVPLAILASPLLPQGLPRMAEPDPGVMVDGYLLWWGAAAAAVIVTAIALIAGIEAGATNIRRVTNDGRGIAHDDRARCLLRVRPRPVVESSTRADVSRDAIRTRADEDVDALDGPVDWNPGRSRSHSGARFCLERGSSRRLPRAVRERLRRPPWARPRGRPARGSA